MEGEVGSADKIVAGEFVSVNDGKVERVIGLMAQYLENQLLLENWIEIVLDDTGTVCLFP